MTRPKPTKLAAPYRDVTVSVERFLGGEFAVRVHSSETGKSNWTSLDLSLATARAILKANRKHKAQVKRDAAKDDERE